MKRALWKGFLTFGLIQIPVKLHGVTSEKDLAFTLLHKKDLSPIRSPRICSEDGSEVAPEDIVRGFATKEGDYVIVTDDDIAHASSGRNTVIELERFTDPHSIDPLYFEQTYVLAPAPEGERAYALLREALRQSGKGGIARFTFRGREHVCLIVTHGKGLLVHQLRYHDELSLPSPTVFPAAKIRDYEMQLALALIGSMAGEFHPEDYHDTYVQTLKTIIKEKAEGKELPLPEIPATAPSDMSELLPLLKASIERRPKRTLAKPPKQREPSMEHHEATEEVAPVRETR